MDIFIYTDESGVFDVAHNRYYVFGGLMFFSKAERDVCARKYSKAENDIRKALKIPADQEVKASVLPVKYRNKLFRSLNNEMRFGVVIDEELVLQRIFKSKKDKQRYLDYVYKIAVKRCLEYHISEGRLNAADVRNVHVFVDEHTTATNGRYELGVALEHELVNGTYNYGFDCYFPPVFPDAKSVDVLFCNSSKKTLIRAADIIANKIFYYANNTPEYSSKEADLFVIRQPK